MEVNIKDQKNKNKEGEVVSQRKSLVETGISLEKGEIPKEKDIKRSFSLSPGEIRSNLDKEDEEPVLIKEGEVAEEAEKLVLRDNIRSIIEENSYDEKKGAVPASLENVMAPAAEVEEVRTAQTKTAFKEVFKELFRTYFSDGGDDDVLLSLYNKGNREMGEGEAGEAYSELLSSYNEVRSFFLEKFGHDAPEISDAEINKACRLLTRLSQAADDYYDLHRGHRNTERGKERKDFANKTRDAVKRVFRKLHLATGDVEIPEVREYTKDEASSHKSNVEKITKLYSKWCKHISKQSLISPEQKIREKYDLLSIYKEDLLYYKQNIPVGKNKETDRIIREYEHLTDMILTRRWAGTKVLSAEEAEELKRREKENDIPGYVRKCTNETDEKLEKSFLDKAEVDKNLTKEQLDGINKIDQWFVRNWNNGGITGNLGITSLRIHLGRIITKLFSLTKRERLHIYYLIETGARKRPSTLDIGISQTTYVPSLSAFKDQMLATKWKSITTRWTGSYVYVHKLSEAMQITEGYKEEVKDSCLVAELIKNKKKEADKWEDPSEENLPEERNLILTGLCRELQEYMKSLEACKGAKGEKREELDRAAKGKAAAVKTKLEQLVAVDDRIGEVENALLDAAEKNVDIKNRKNTNKDDTLFFSGLGATVLAQTDKLNYGELATSKAGLGCWKLKDAKWDKLELTGSSLSAAFSAAGTLFAGTFQLLNLVNNHQHMGRSDALKNALDIVKDVAETAISIWTGVEHGKDLGSWAANSVKNASMEAKEVDYSKALKTAGFVTAGAATAINLVETGSIIKKACHTGSAIDYFKRKKARIDLQAGDGELNDDEKMAKKKARFDVGMSKLGSSLNKRNASDNLMSYISNGLTFISLTFPGVGAIATVTGISWSIISSIASVAKLSSIRTGMFDAYYNIDEVFKEVKRRLPEHRKKDEKALLEQLRTLMAAEAGYADTASACDHIAMVYARRVRDKLFGGPGIAAESEEERKAYIDIVNAYGLSYKPESGEPTEFGLIMKMSGR